MSKKKIGLGGLLAVGAAAAAAGAVIAYLRNEEIKKVTQEVLSKFKAEPEIEFEEEAEAVEVCENPECCFESDLDDGMPEVILEAGESEEPEAAEAVPEEAVPEEAEKAVATEE